MLILTLVLFYTRVITSGNLSSNNTLTLPIIDDTLVSRNTTETLTNKTLTSPTINGGSVSGTFSGNHTFSDIGTHSSKDVFNAGISVKNETTGAGFIEFYESTSNGTNSITLLVDLQLQILQLHFLILLQI